MKTKMTPLVSWSVWAVGLSLVMGTVTRSHLLAGFAADKTGMSYVITALFLAGLVVSFLSAKKLHDEWGVLAHICKTNTLPQSADRNDITSVFQRLADYKEKKETVNIHTVIDTYHSKHNSRVRSVSIMAALVISMGLLGTVVGLIMSISGLGSMVENIGLSKNGMMDAMRLTFAGMGTAFYTTFFGALAGLILRAVAVSQLNSLSELCSEAAEYADANLVVKLESNEEAMNQQVTKLIASFESMQFEINALTGRISESIQDTMAAFRSSIVEVGDHAMTATREAVTGMTEQMGTFGTTIEESLAGYNTMISEAGNGVRESIGTVNDAIVRSGEALEESFGTLNTTLADSGVNVDTSFNGLSASVQQAGDTVSGSLADFKLSVDGTALELNDAVGKLHAAVCEVTGELVTMNKAKLDAEATQIAGHLSIAADSIQQFLSTKVSAANNTAEDENQKVA
ncbi:MotA/TolQ/ExbB proton channel family protein [Pontiella agarivorans]|uniref:MotA/TolQ/ExbB proton channel family protein n=1 Tax=Pontiella agarivorans TaxID=3038953 RepID=A0ABU5MVN6_9BACT|nr:MotA/TolQ/ExbB proton channel family protein [Pontiella agarivorans]MDZ8118280.1 MotA/TolQ/ExbB proton channel family protein [Pontiella agarivorans]